MNHQADSKPWTPRIGRKEIRVIVYFKCLPFVFSIFRARSHDNDNDNGKDELY